MIQGPRFSTRAESKLFQSQGWEVINMTQYPECYLARELEICYVNISLITDYDVGLEGIAPVSRRGRRRGFQTEQRARARGHSAKSSQHRRRRRLFVQARARGSAVVDDRAH